MSLKWEERMFQETNKSSRELKLSRKLRILTDLSQTQWTTWQIHIRKRIIAQILLGTLKVCTANLT